MVLKILSERLTKLWNATLESIWREWRMQLPETKTRHYRSIIRKSVDWLANRHDHETTHLIRVVMPARRLINDRPLAMFKICPSKRTLKFSIKQQRSCLRMINASGSTVYVNIYCDAFCTISASKHPSSSIPRNCKRFFSLVYFLLVSLFFFFL